MKFNFAPVRLRLVLNVAPVLAAVFFLAACGARVEQTVTFFTDEVWAAEMSIELSRETMAMMGTLGDFGQAMDEAVAELRAEGLSADWELEQNNEDTARYILTAEGEGLALLNEAVFDNRASIQRLNGNEIHFAYRLTGDLLDAEQTTIRLVGGRVLESNGVQVNRSTVEWVEPRGTMEAVLTGRSPLLGGDGLMIGGLVVAFVALVGGARFFASRQRKQKLAFCARCGRELGPRAQFCPGCGTPRQ